jgi:hypothetical protein
MKAILFNEISNVISQNTDFEVIFYPIHKGCEIEFKNISFMNDELKELFEEWFYDELIEILIEYDAFADSINAHFKLQGEKLSIHLTLVCSDRQYDSNENHQKEEILKEELVLIIRKAINNYSDEFNPELIDFSFEYNEGFRSFGVYYGDNKVEFSLEQEVLIKEFIKNILLKWSPVFKGKSALSVDRYIEIDFADFFHLDDIVEYEFEFERES